MKIKFVKTCDACPEQYEAFDEKGKQVGYLRLRHGHFRVDYPQHAGETIYEANPQGDGIFDDEERDFFLQQAYNAIVSKLSRTKDDEQSWYIVDDETYKYGQLR
jgi:hypothetical protein